MKTLAKEIPKLYVDKAGPVFTINDGKGWELIVGSTYIYQTFFDLAGMSQREKTLFFEAATVQESLPPFASPTATAGDGIVVVDIMSTKQLRPNEALNYSTDANFAGSGTTLTFDQTIYGRTRVFNVDIDNAAGGYYIVLGDGQTGSLDATASDRIYCTRVVAIGSNNGDGTHGVGAARYLIRANAREEPEYEYLMRLKRSYELQQSHDED